MRPLCPLSTLKEEGIGNKIYPLPFKDTSPMTQLFQVGGPQSRFLLPPNGTWNHCSWMDGSTDRAEPSRAHHPEGAASELCGTGDWAFTMSFAVLQTQAQQRESSMQAVPHNREKPKA